MRTAPVVAIVLAASAAIVGVGVAVARTRVEPSPFAAYHAIPVDAARAFGERVAAEFSSGATTAFDAAFDLVAVMQQVIRDMPMPARTRGEFLDGARKGLAQSGTVGKQTLAGLGGTIEARLLRVREGQDGQHAILRVVGATGLNYLELVLREDPAGAPRIVDIYNHVAATLTSEALRTAAVQAVSSLNGSALKRLLGGDDEVAAAYQALPGIQAMIRSGRNAEALAELRALPAKVGETRAIMILRLGCAQAIDEREQLAELDAIERRFGAGDDLALVRMDAYTLRKDWKRAVACARAVGTAIGGDHYLDAYASDLLAQGGDPAAAAELGDAAVAGEPETKSVWWLAIAGSLHAGDHERTARLLGGIQDRFGVELDGVETAKDYQAFVASPAYAGWRAAHPRR